MVPTNKEQSLGNVIKEANANTHTQKKIKAVTALLFLSFTRNQRIFNVLCGAIR